MISVRQLKNSTAACFLIAGTAVWLAATPVGAASNTTVVKEMRHVWFGSDTHAGARELGPKWIRALETKQKDQFGRTHTFTPRSSANRN